MASQFGSTEYNEDSLLSNQVGSLLWKLWSKTAAELTAAVGELQGTSHGANPIHTHRERETLTHAAYTHTHTHARKDTFVPFSFLLL